MQLIAKLHSYNLFTFWALHLHRLEDLRRLKSALKKLRAFLKSAASFDSKFAKGQISQIPYNLQNSHNLWIAPKKGRC